ncbi:large conductance mechanosensitive channel protein MscL [Streptomyces sp. NPDC049577]|uniref:large conductance mechanosensitive channel protein MscL n=1 Tax=Streptomyces sp. NPDC049577 TaxID=3155153 RepID=UPI00342DBEC5
MSDSASGKKTGVLGGFKAFLMRGNVVDLAVAVVIGAAFTNIVNSVVKGVINPIVGAFGTSDLDRYAACLKGPCTRKATGEVTQGVYIQWGAVLSASLTFLITAAVVYFLMLLPMKRWQERQAARSRTTTEPAAPAETELELLAQIRDTLLEQRRGPGTDSVPAQR